MFPRDQLLGNGSDQITNETIKLAKQALSGALGVLDKGMLAKAGVDTTTALYGYPLEAPAKLLVPILTPLRNTLSRVPVTKLGVGSMAGSALNWKVITSYNAAKVWGSVGFGNRNSQVTYTEADKSASFKSFGLDSQVQDEAIFMGQNFMDVKAFDAMALLRQCMVIEEKLILAGNPTALDKPATPSTSGVTQLATALGSLTASTSYKIRVSALTLQGIYAAAQGNGGTDALGESTPSDMYTVSTAAGGQAGDTSISFKWTAKRGALAYNIYAATAVDGVPKYVTTVYTNVYDLTALGTSTNVVNTLDKTGNAYDFQGLISQISDVTYGGYWKSLDNSALTADGVQGIVEIDAALKSLYDNSRIGVDEFWVSTQESTNMPKKLVNAGSSSVTRFVINQGDSQAQMDAGSGVQRYYNKYTGQWIPIRTHPDMPAGTLMGLTHRLPDWFPNNGVSEAVILATLMEYADYDFARVARAYPHGVYASEALVMYAPSFSMVLTNIKNG